MIKVIISGVNGRMGKAVEALCKADEAVEIVGGIDINLGVPHEFPTADNAFALETRADAIIDFSHHTCAAALCDYAAKTGTPGVFATTGYTPEELETIRKAAEKAAAEVAKRIENDFERAEILKRTETFSETDAAYVFTFELSCLENIAVPMELEFEE